VSGFSRTHDLNDMKPWELLGEAVTPDGTTLTLTKHDRELVIMANGQPLMSSRMHGSEEALAEFGLRLAAPKLPKGQRQREAPCVLVGGLGMGFTLRATLDLLPPDATVVVAELLPAVVEWNRGPLGPLANHPLTDPRVQIVERDVGAILRTSECRFDAVLLDVDNGPTALTSDVNADLYSDRGIATAKASLKPDGVLAVWSSREDRRFEQRLKYGGFEVTVERVRGRLKKGGPRHVIFLGSLSRGV
jgi:spermidine synthase